MMDEQRSDVRSTPQDRQSKQAGDWLRRAGETLIRASRDFINDNGPQWAAAIAYYSLLSTFPLILAIASISSFFIDSAWAIERTTSLLGEFLPGGEEEIANIVNEAIETRGTVSILSIAALLWSGSRVFGVVTIALNIAYDVDETYSFLKRTLVELIMLLTIGLFFVLALASRSVLNLAGNVLGLGDEALLFQLARTILPGLLLLLAFFLIYRLVPRREVHWQAAVPGAILATILFLIARPLFWSYVETFADYGLVYGPIAIIIILVIWAWLTAMILLFGGEVVAHIQDMLIEGKSAEEVEQEHLKRSPMRKDAAAKNNGMAEG